MSFERIQIFLESNPEYGWMLVFLFGFMESMIITGSFMPSAILFSELVLMINLSRLKRHDFLIKGINSKLVNENIIIKAETINGKFSEKANEKEITYLEVIDKNISYIKNHLIIIVLWLLIKSL